ncbi:hypothetical protein AAF712_012864 [Marasmius tenuissimus]|uniref:Uncharacterized protein n=1 Tax=Marasmius tenuissimus TaxID=585030 RepID=A0ABR2ZHD1_9AGAR
MVPESSFTAVKFCLVPRVWFGVETALSVVRIILWGSNPSWDEQNTGITLELELFDKSSEISPHLDSDMEAAVFGFQAKPGPGESPPVADKGTTQMFQVPIITSPRHLRLLTEPLSTLHPDENLEQWERSFISPHLEDFLTAVEPYATRHLNRIQVDGHSIYYAVLAEVSQDHTRKLLCATVVPHGAGSDALSFLFAGGTSWHSIFASHTRSLRTRALEVTFHEKLDRGSAHFDHGIITRLVHHSSILFYQLFTQHRLHLSWLFSPIATEAKQCGLSLLDKQYMRIGQLCDLKGDYCLDVGNMTGDICTNVPLRVPFGELFYEHATMFISAVQETYLCIMEQCFIRCATLSDGLSRYLALQWIQKMEARLSAEKTAASTRVRAWLPQDETMTGIDEIWDLLTRELRSLRLLPPDDPVLQRWEFQFSEIKEGRDSFHLFELPPFTSSRTVQSNFETHLLPFLSNSPNGHHELVASIKTSLQYLHSVKPPPYFGRIDPKGPGSPAFSPPYATLNAPLMDTIIGEFREQIYSEIKILILANESAVARAYEILLSLSTSSLSLTSIIHRDVIFTRDKAVSLCKLLRRHRNITFVLYDECEHFSGPKADGEVINAIEYNRRMWREGASAREFRYQIGLEDIPELVDGDFRTNFSSVVASGHDLQLQPRVRVTARVHVPVHGKILPILSARTLLAVTPKFDAILVHLPTPSTSFMVCKGKKQVDSVQWNALKFDDFPGVPPGYYEVHIMTQNHSAYLFRDLVVEFTPTIQDFRRTQLNANPSESGSSEDEMQGQTRAVSNLDRQAKIDATPHDDQVSLETSNGSGPGHLEISETLTCHDVSPPACLFWYSMEGPASWYHDSRGANPTGGTRHFQLDKLTVILLFIERDREPTWSWVPRDSHLDPEEQAQDSGGVGQPMKGDVDPRHYQDSLEVKYALSDEPSPVLMCKSDPPSVYRLRFGLYDSAGHWHYGSVAFYPPTARHYNLRYITAELSPLTRKLQLKLSWSDPDFDSDASEVEQGIDQGRYFTVVNEIEGHFVHSPLGEPKEKPPGPEPESAEPSGRQEEEDDSRVPHPPNDPETHSDYHSIEVPDSNV